MRIVLSVDCDSQAAWGYDVLSPAEITTYNKGNK